MTEEDNTYTNDLTPNDDTGRDVIEEIFKNIERREKGEPQEEIQEEEPEEETEEVEPEEEEVEDSSDDEEDFEEEEELRNESQLDLTKKPEKAWKEKKKRFKAQAETRAALEEKRQVLEENARLKEMLRQAETAGTYQYSKNVYADLEKAKQLKKRALEEGDADADIDATVLINKAIYNINELEKWSAYETAQPQNQQNAYLTQQNQEAIERQIGQDWLSTHKELQLHSKYYNPELTKTVGEFVEALDYNIDRSGQQNVKFSDRYFEVIDDYIDDLKSKMRSEKAKKNIGAIGNVGSVRNSYSTSLHNTAPKTKKITLTPLEKDMAERGGISEEEWIKRKEKYINK